MQRNAEKIIVTEKDIKKTNKDGMGNQVGTITNYITSMMEVQSHFSPNSKEYKELEYRIRCGQLYQQNSLDKIKGIIATPMPSYWYNLGACGEDKYLQSLCAYRKPYFMIYVYDETKRLYKNYIKESNAKCRIVYGCSIDELYNKEELTYEQQEFLFWYEYKMPVGLGDCSMNKICRYIESQLDGYKSQLHKQSDFDYTTLKVKRRCTQDHFDALMELQEYYCECIKEYKTKVIQGKDEANNNRYYLYQKFNKEAIEICPNDDERLNIVLDITYKHKGNKQFCWDIIGVLLCKRLEEMKNVYIE